MQAVDPFCLEHEGWKKKCFVFFDLVELDFPAHFPRKPTQSQDTFDTFSSQSAFIASCTCSDIVILFI